MGPGIFSSKCHGLPKLKWDLDHFTGWPDYKMNYKTNFVVALRPVILYRKIQQGYAWWSWWKPLCSSLTFLAGAWSFSGRSQWKNLVTAYRKAQKRDVARNFLECSLVLHALLNSSLVCQLDVGPGVTPADACRRPPNRVCWVLPTVHWSFVVFFVENCWLIFLPGICFFHVLPYWFSCTPDTFHARLCVRERLRTCRRKVFPSFLRLVICCSATLHDS